jgi:hypothetical protein
MSVDFETLLTVVFVLVDDWYQVYGQYLLSGKRGAKPTFGDTEVLTLLLCQDFIPFPGETQFLGFIRANYWGCFPALLSQSQFNRRARALRLVLEKLRQYWIDQLGATEQQLLLLDAKPVPVVGYKRDKRHSAFCGSADYGVCVSRKLRYFGFKLVALTTLDGVPVAFELVPANTDDRLAAESVLGYVYGCDIFADKGFLGDIWQDDQRDWHGNRIWTAKKKNQPDQKPKVFDQLLNSVRERIEGAFNEVQNTGRNLERLLAKTILGLCTRVIAKMASHALKLVLRRFYGIDVQTFKYLAAV